MPSRADQRKKRSAGEAGRSVLPRRWPARSTPRNRPKHQAINGSAMLPQQGVKDEELAWTGVDEFLKDKPSVTKSGTAGFCARKSGPDQRD